MQSAAGFSLLETLVATTVVTVGVGALAQLLVLSAHTNRHAQAMTRATALAQHKMEQLRALTWGFDESGVPLTDTTSDTRVVPETPSGGTGLTPSTASPGDTLAANVVGYCDFVDAAGQPLHSGTAAVPVSAAYIRRWAIAPLPANPSRAVVIQVHVVGATPATSSDVARLVGVRTRRGF